MKGTVAILDQLDTVSARVGLQRRIGRPRVSAAVFDLLGDGLQRHDVGARSAQQQKSDGPGARRLKALSASVAKSSIHGDDSVGVGDDTHRPFDLKRAAHGNNLVERPGNGVPTWVAAHRGRRGAGQRGQAGGEQRKIDEHHFQSRNKTVVER